MQEDTSRWSVELSGGRTEMFNAVVSATGLLNVPRYPDWPGPDTFDGPTFHTARWPEDVELAGKRVAIAGSGPTAAQVVPAVAEQAAQVLMFQREPGWVLPKGASDLTVEERRASTSTIAQRLTRWYMLMQREKASHRNYIWRPGSKRNEAAERASRAFIASSFAYRPDLAKAVTPDFPFGGKRPVVTDELYQAVKRDNVRLVPAAVQISHLKRGKADAIEVRPSALNIFNRVVQHRLAGTSLERANNYFKSSSGRVVTQWSDGAMTYVTLTKQFRRAVWRTRTSVNGAQIAARLAPDATDVNQTTARMRAAAAASGVKGGLSKLRTTAKDAKTLIALDAVTVFSLGPVNSTNEAQ